MNRWQLENRLLEVRDICRMRIVEELLDSRQLRERRPWLAVLDLVEYQFGAMADFGRRLEVPVPDDNGPSLHKWMESQSSTYNKNLSEDALTRKSYRTHCMAMLDEWEPTQALIRNAVGEAYRQIQNNLASKQSHSSGGGDIE